MLASNGDITVLRAVPAADAFTISFHRQLAGAHSRIRMMVVADPMLDFIVDDEFPLTDIVIMYVDDDAVHLATLISVTARNYRVAWRRRSCASFSH